MDIKTKLCVTKIFDSDLVAMHKIKVTLTLNKPAYVGMCIPDLHKLLMNFIMIILKISFGNNARLLFTDTDSLMCEIKIEDLFVDFSEDREILAIVQLSQNVIMMQKKLVAGKMKDETGGVAIEESVGLEAKMYSLLVVDNSKDKKANGVNKNSLENITHGE